MHITGNAELRAGSVDYLRWQLLQGDGVTPISLLTATSVSIRFENLENNTVKTFSTADKLVIVDAANGVIELRQETTDFPSEAVYQFYVIVTDSNGGHPVPERENYILKVIRAF